MRYRRTGLPYCSSRTTSPDHHGGMSPMAAFSTLSQQNVSRKSPISKTGVLTLSGFGIKVRMQRGHLEIEDGVGMERRTIRLPRVGHGLKRLIVIGCDGFVSL